VPLSAGAHNLAASGPDFDSNMQKKLLMLFAIRVVTYIQGEDFESAEIEVTNQRIKSCTSVFNCKMDG
jgi:hypothetical protein